MTDNCIPAGELAGTAELLELLGFSARGHLKYWRDRDPTFPAPVITLRMGPVWDRRAVLEWNQRRLGVKQSHVDMLAYRFAEGGRNLGGRGGLQRLFGGLAGGGLGNGAHHPLEQRQRGRRHTQRAVPEAQQEHDPLRIGRHLATHTDADSRGHAGIENHLELAHDRRTDAQRFVGHPGSIRRLGGAVGGPRSVESGIAWMRRPGACECGDSK